MKENKDSGAEESDSLNSLHELNNNISNCKTSNELTKDSHLFYQAQSPATSINTFSSYTSSSNNNSVNSTPKIYTPQNNEITNNVNSSSSNSTSSTSIASSTKVQDSHRLTTAVHHPYYVPMLSQQTVNKVSLSNLSRDSGLTLSDTQLYSPEEDNEDCDDYQHILAQHLHLSKKLNSIVSDKCLSTNKNNNQFKINTSNKITNNSTSLKKKCNNNKINRLTASSEEDDLHDLEDGDIDELSEKSCASENCRAPLYSRVYNKHGVSEHHLLTKSAPQLVNIGTIGQTASAMNDQQTKNNGKSTTPLYLNSIKNSISSNSATNSSCNSPSSASNLSSTSLNLSSCNESSTSDIQRNYFTSLTPESHLASTPIATGDLFKAKQPHIVTISAKGNIMQVNQKPTVCNVSINKENLNPSLVQKSPPPTQQQLVNNNQKLLTSQQVPPSYQETMNRKEMNARIANRIQSSTSRKISDSEIENLISKKIYEQSLRVYNADVHKELTLRAVPVHVKSQSSSDSESDSDPYPKRKITNSNTTVKLANKSAPFDQVDSNYTAVRIKPIILQRCAKDETEYWKKDVNWSVATLRNKFTELCKQNECSMASLNRKNLTHRMSGSKTNACKSISSIYDLCKVDSKGDQQIKKPPINKLRSSLSQSTQILDNNSKNCVTIIQVMHGNDKLNSNQSTDSLSGEESYV